MRTQMEDQNLDMQTMVESYLLILKKPPFALILLIENGCSPSQFLTLAVYLRRRVQQQKD
jgi:hypothetical protein